MRKKKEYFGYNRKVPERIILQEIQRQTLIDGFVQSETRYIIVDADTGEVFDNAQGYGYKTKQKAMAAFNYSKRSKDEFTKEKETKEKVREFLKTHKSFVNILESIAFDELKCGGKLTPKMVEQVIKAEHIELPDGISCKDVLKYW